MYNLQCFFNLSFWTHEYIFFVISSGGLATTHLSKQKLVITPVLSQLTQTSTSLSAAGQSHLAKHMTNLLLPVNIPQQTSSVKQNMLNLKINNGHVGTDNKGTITGEFNCNKDFYFLTLKQIKLKVKYNIKQRFVINI